MPQKIYRYDRVKKNGQKQKFYNTHYIRSDFMNVKKVSVIGTGILDQWDSPGQRYLGFQKE
jgi:hypothetical protein